MSVRGIETVQQWRKSNTEKFLYSRILSFVNIIAGSDLKC